MVSALITIARTLALSLASSHTAFTRRWSFRVTFNIFTSSGTVGVVFNWIIAVTAFRLKAKHKITS